MCFDAAGKTVAVLLFDQYHGDVSNLLKNMRNYATHPKETVIHVPPPASGPDCSLRHILRLTYPSCRTMAEMADASARSQSMYPQHPAVQLANAAFMDTALFCKYEIATECSKKLQQIHAHAASVAGSVLLPPVKCLSPGSHFFASKGTIGFTPQTRRQSFGAKLNVMSVQALALAVLYKLCLLVQYHLMLKFCNIDLYMLTRRLVRKLVCVCVV